MKKLSGLLGSIFAISLLAGCNSQAVNQFPLEQVAPTQQVSAMSEQGLIQVNRYIGKFYFTALDANKDGFLSLAEYNKSNISTANDMSVRFKKVDKNSDKKISIDEMMNNRKNFLPEIFGKDNLRNMARTSFDFFNTDKDDVISHDEFLKIPTGAPTNSQRMAKADNNGMQITLSSDMQVLLNVMFNLSDLNKNNELSFSEFEDFIYSGIKGNPNLNPVSETTDKPADPRLTDPFTHPDTDDYGQPIIPADDDN
jgi:Ca2+-binding EF-hand superfamily protein